ncbi:MAG TPA: hypothetical protein DDY20_05290 [Desulfobulbaceae bacterium]|nr:hypothetical protein [Desulfobulbaceae bacterium]
MNSITILILFSPLHFNAVILPVAFFFISGALILRNLPLLAAKILWAQAAIDLLPDSSASVQSPPFLRKRSPLSGKGACRLSRT